MTKLFVRLKRAWDEARLEWLEESLKAYTLARNALESKQQKRIAKYEQMRKQLSVPAVGGAVINPPGLGVKPHR